MAAKGCVFRCSSVGFVRRNTSNNRNPAIWHSEGLEIHLAWTDRINHHWFSRNYTYKNGNSPICPGRRLGKIDQCKNLWADVHDLCLEQSHKVFQVGHGFIPGSVLYPFRLEVFGKQRKLFGIAVDSHPATPPSTLTGNDLGSRLDSTRGRTAWVETHKTSRFESFHYCSKEPFGQDLIWCLFFPAFPICYNGKVTYILPIWTKCR